MWCSIWQGLNKMSSRLCKPDLTDKQKEVVETFKHKMDSTFIITDDNAEEIIAKDRLRDDSQKEEDLAFLRSMKGDRKATVSSKDTVYQERVDNKLKRLEDIERRKMDHNSNENTRVIDTEAEGNEVIDDETDDDYLEKKEKRKKAETVNIEVPKNIVQLLAPTASRYDISSTALSSILLQTVAAGGGDISSLPLSRRQVERSTKASIADNATSIKEKFMTTARDKFLVCHFDGKQLAEMTMGVKSKKERLSVLVSSPDLEQPQILGALPLDGQTGDDIFHGVLSLLEEFGITDRVIAMSFDTTASNTGPDQGACARLEKHLERALLWLACRRHVMELHIKHVAKDVAKEISGRAATGPKNTLFKRLQDSWSELLPMIDLTQLTKFDWKKVEGTALETQAESALQILGQFLKNKTFVREDYKELCELAVLFLGGAVPNFKFQYPGACHNARYMAQAIYMLKMNLLLDKITWLLDVERQEVKLMAEFISIFYVIWWLQGYLGVNAPMNDLKAMQQMRMYRQFNQLVSDTCMASWRRHTWYLTEELVVLCLADISCPFRDAVAAAIVQQDILDSFPPKKPKLPPVLDNIWPMDEAFQVCHFLLVQGLT